MSVHSPLSKSQCAFLESETVARIVIPRIRKLVDVGRVHDGFAGNGGEAVQGQGTGVFVGGDNAEAEAGFSRLLLDVYRAPCNPRPGLSDLRLEPEGP